MGTHARGTGSRWNRVLRGARMVPVAVIVVVVLAVSWWVLRFPDAEAGPLQAVLDHPDLATVVDDDLVVMTPADGMVDDAPTVVFYPGAGVPPEAYAANWAPVVEATDATVLIPSMPLRLAVLDRDAAAELRARPRSTGEWWIGGHSLGGAMAARHLAENPGRWDGLVLWGAYPAGDGLAADDRLEVVSVTGSRDGLTTPDDVADSATDLPADARFVELDGVNHAQFGAYGDQTGDLPATVDDDTARAAIAEATTAALRD